MNGPLEPFVLLANKPRSRFEASGKRPLCPSPFPEDRQGRDRCLPGSILGQATR